MAAESGAARWINQLLRLNYFATGDGAIPLKRNTPRVLPSFQKDCPSKNKVIFKTIFLSIVMSFKSFRFPKNDSQYLWTNHILGKMRYYGISEQRVRKIIRMPERKEDGIAPKTIAVMNAVKSKNKPHEIWVMYQLTNSKIKNPADAKALAGKQKSKLTPSPKLILISAWRYPGRSPTGKKIDIPAEVLDDLQKFLHS